MKRSWTLHGAWLLLATSGCFDLGDVKLESTLEDVYKFADYHFLPPAAYDGSGHNATHPWLNDTQRIPHGVQVLMKTQGSDLSVAVNKKGTIFVANFDAVFASRDHGLNWTKIHDLKSENYPVQEDRFKSSGVSLHVDSITDRLYLSHLNSCAFLVWTDDEGKTWEKSDSSYWPQSCVTPYQIVAEQRVFTGKAGPNTQVPASLRTYPSVLYICGTGFPIFQVACSVSFDGGETFPYIGLPIVPPFIPCTILALGHPAVSEEGVIVVPIGLTQTPQSCSTYTRPTVAVSRDSGLTWEIRHFGEGLQTEIAPTVVFSNGTAYMTTRDATYRIQVYRSKDYFQTKSGPFDVSLPETTLSSHGTIVAGDEGRLSIAYIATKREQKQARYFYGGIGGHPAGAAQNSFWHFFVASTDNGHEENPIFVTEQSTPDEDPIHIGCIQYVPQSSFYQRAFSRETYECRNTLNFMESSSTPDGRFVFAISDGCAPRNGCTIDTAGGYQARERTPSIMVQDAGMSLFTSKGLLTPLGLIPPQPEPRDCCPKGS